MPKMTSGETARRIKRKKLKLVKSLFYWQRMVRLNLNGVIGNWDLEMLRNMTQRVLRFFRLKIKVHVIRVIEE